jgi:hypothetical protein
MDGMGDKLSAWLALSLPLRRSAALHSGRGASLTRARRPPLGCLWLGDAGCSVCHAGHLLRR